MSNTPTSNNNTTVHEMLVKFKPNCKPRDTKKMVAKKSLSPRILLDTSKLTGRLEMLKPAKKAPMAAENPSTTEKPMKINAIERDAKNNNSCECDACVKMRGKM